MNISEVINNTISYDFEDFYCYYKIPSIIPSPKPTPKPSTNVLTPKPSTRPLTKIFTPRISSITKSVNLFHKRNLNTLFHNLCLRQ